MDSTSTKSGKTAILPAAVLSALLSAASFADEPATLIEEVTVTGAVRGSASVEVADIDMPGDDTLPEIPVVTE